MPNISAERDVTEVNLPFAPTPTSFRSSAVLPALCSHPLNHSCAYVFISEAVANYFPTGRVLRLPLGQIYDLTITL